MPLSLLQVVNNLVQAGYNKLGTSNANTTCWQLADNACTRVKTHKLLQVCQKVVTSRLQVVKIRLVATCYLQTCYNLLKQVSTSLYMLNHLQQACWQLATDMLSQAVASHANASWYRLIVTSYCKMSTCRLACYNLRVFGCVCQAATIQWAKPDWKLFSRHS